MRAALIAFAFLLLAAGRGYAFDNGREFIKECEAGATKPFPQMTDEEKKLGESVDYLHHVVDVSPSAFLRFASILPFANSRKVLPKDAWFVAQIVALKREDKVLPGAVVRDLLAEKVAAIEAAEARNVGRKEKLELKEQIIDDLLPF